MCTIFRGNETIFDRLSLKVNMDHRAFKCQVGCCNEHFSSKYNLQRHVNSIHLNIRRFHCDVCNKRFTSKQTLTEHVYIHSGERPFQCSISGCLRNFRQASQLYIHRKKHHIRCLNSSGEMACKRSRYYVHDFEDQFRELPRIASIRSDMQLGARLPTLSLLLGD
mmetsp:Transcript_10147/g.19903  ORF Transcript_10147/g.19903 Transcript_10147/m.19903 type:complete len:165 (-) Transcript_10147:1034-1528(-)